MVTITTKDVAVEAYESIQTSTDLAKRLAPYVQRKDGKICLQANELLTDLCAAVKLGGGDLDELVRNLRKVWKHVVIEKRH